MRIEYSWVKREFNSTADFAASKARELKRTMVLTDTRGIFPEDTGESTGAAEEQSPEDHHSQR